jgi:choline monooxygenase
MVTMAESGLENRKAESAARGVYGLPARWYWERAIYDAERRQIFAREWQLVCPASDLPGPGDYVAAEVAGYRIFVIRDRDGQLRGFHNVCPHRASQLLEDGQGHRDLLRCPYHGWVFDTQGNLRRAPDFGEADWFKKEEHGLMPIRVETWRGLVFANLDADARPLEDALGSLPETVKEYPIEGFTKVRQVEFEMRCNWKTYTDNFVEGYHIPGIHPAFHAVIDFSRFEATHGDALVIMTAPQKSGSIYGGLWLWGWPNFTLSVYPGGMNCSRIVPVSENRTRLVYSFFFRDTSAAARERNERTIETNAAIVREDFGICERSQANLQAGIFQRGPLSPKHEVGVRYFHDRVRQALGREGIVEQAWLG